MYLFEARAMQFNKNFVDSSFQLSTLVLFFQYELAPLLEGLGLFIYQSALVFNLHPLIFFLFRFSISQETEDVPKKVYVGGIPYYSTEDDIRSFFEGCGTITEIDCLTFPETESGKFRGIAMISFKASASLLHTFLFLSINAVICALCISF